MKSEFNTEIEKKKFKPFSVTITAETIEDARLLLHLFNCNDLGSVLKDTYYDFKKGYNKNVTEGLDLSNETYRVIDEYIKNSGYEL
jgi:hypothetical protein